MVSPSVNESALSALPSASNRRLTVKKAEIMNLYRKTHVAPPNPVHTGNAKIKTQVPCAFVEEVIGSAKAINDYTGASGKHAQRLRRGLSAPGVDDTDMDEEGYESIEDEEDVKETMKTKE
jgi:hypothetical protein